MIVGLEIQLVFSCHFSANDNIKLVKLLTFK